MNATAIGDLGRTAADAASGYEGSALELLRALVRIPTHEPAGCCQAASLVEQQLRALGFEPESHAVAGLCGERLPLVLAWLGPRSAAPALVLCAHLDTSPPGPGWREDPYGAERRDGAVFGRGAALAKGDVAAYLHALCAARDVVSGNFSTSALLAITADEGSGGALGPGYLLETLGIRPERALTAGFTHRVGTAHNGAIQARLCVRGRANHQALVAPESDAMRHAVAVASALIAEGDALAMRGCSVPGIAHPTLNVTRLRGGAELGMAPGEVELLIDRRVTPDETLDQAGDDLERLLDLLATSVPVALERELLTRAEPLRPSDEQRPWAELVQREARAVLGEDVPLAGVPLYTDARWFAERGIPTLLYGAGGDDLTALGLNGVDEHVAERDLADATRVLARVVARTLGAPGASRET